jgi:hypothetical protein
MSVPPRCRGEDRVEPDVFKRRVAAPIDTGHPAKKKGSGAFALDPGDHGSQEMRRNIRQTEQAETTSPGLREPDEAIDPPRNQFARALRIVEACRHRVQFQGSTPGVHHVRLGDTIEPVRRRTRHGAICGDAIQNEIEHKNAPGLAAQLRKLLDRSVGFRLRLYCRIRALEIVGQENVVVRTTRKDRSNTNVREAHGARAREVVTPTRQ